MGHYAGQMIAMFGGLGELIINGVTYWFYLFASLFIILGIINGIHETISK